MSTNPLFLLGLAAAGIVAFMMYRKRKRSRLDRMKGTLEHASMEMNKKVQELRSRSA